MKKRLLALALCLVMMTSLLPLSAAAEEFTVNSVHVVGDFCNWAFSDSYPMQAIGSGVYELTISNANRSDFFDGRGLNFAINNEWTHSFAGTFVGSGVESDALYNAGLIRLDCPYSLADITFRLDLSQFNYATKQGATFTITITDASHNFDTGWTSDETHHWHKCLNEGCTEVKDKALHVDNNNDHFCDDCQVSIHTWKFSKTDSGTFMATCNPGCTIGKVTVKLNAHSVTLPDSPFHATVEVSENFKEAFPNAQVTGPKYVYFESGKPVDVTRDSFTPKAGQYQAQAYIDGLPGGGEIAARAMGNEDGIVGTHVDLWVDYTAADPKVTAQTGDNRPIEIMLGSVVVFSALAAAAFILDNKRKYSR